MGTWIVLTVWIAVVGGIDMAAMRPWSSPAARAPLPIGLALAVAGWVLATGTYALSGMLSDGAWTGASIAMGLVPFKAVILSLIAYAAGRTYEAARGSTDARKYILPALLAAVTIYWIAGDVRALRIERLERHAASNALTAEEVSSLVQRIRAGNAERGEASAFLRNPLCPQELLVEYTSSPEAYWRIAVASNDAIDPGLADKLAADANDEVRYFLAFNRKLPPHLLSRLAADASENVRDTVAWTDGLPDDAFARLVEDPSPKVRATAALQSRLTTEQVKKLQNDPEQRVRDAANRRWAPVE